MKINIKKIKQSLQIRNQSYNTFYSDVKHFTLQIGTKELSFKKVINRLNRDNFISINLK